MMNTTTNSGKFPWGETTTVQFNKECTGWTDNPHYNRLFLRQQERYFNCKLKAQGHLFLNEVFDGLGIERRPSGQLLGWFCKDENSHVSFGDGINTETETVLLEFNIDGVVIDMI